MFGTQDFSVFADMEIQWSDGQIMRKLCERNIIELLCVDEIDVYVILLNLIL